MSLAFLRGIQQSPVNSPHKWPVTRKMFPFDDIIMIIWFIYPYFSDKGTILWFSHVCGVALKDMDRIFHCQKPTTYMKTVCLTHCGWVTHISIRNYTTINLGNGLWPVLHQAVIWTIAGLMLTGPFGTNFCEIFIKIKLFPYKKSIWKWDLQKQFHFCPSLC